MTTQQPLGTPPVPRAPKGTSFFAAVRRLDVERSTNRWVSGVAGGIANRFGWDPMIVRGAFFISLFFGGLGFLLYGLGWALLPDARTDRSLLEQAFAGSVGGSLIAAGALVLFGLTSNRPLFGLASGIFSFFRFLTGIFWGLLAVIAVVALVRMIRARNRASVVTQQVSIEIPGTPAASASTFTSTSSPIGFASDRH
ncbi:MAG: PspC domain-containing protein, partial [Promicromonosporaceae bacterium]|nr:PspC domain-containing protein [Promicromonosporaceae bacterium]